MRKLGSLSKRSAVSALAAVVVLGASAGVSWASSSGSKEKPKYSTTEIILGIMGKGIVAHEHPEVSLIPANQAKGVNNKAVAGFLQLASVKDPGFAEKFHSDVTSGDPYKVQKGLQLLDRMSRDVASDVAEKRTAISPASSAGWFFTNDTVAVDAVAVQHWSFATTGAVAAEAAAVVVIVLAVSPEHQNLTTDKAVAALSTGLAG
ncbi:hypothetical protein ACF07B_08035 [Streptomyces sp. NPDC015532]|uniref:hypothetical protein n=1 Tax=Streptomyces sp. NPDC015532 TaxID=3364960 RepID=UPI0036F71430